MNELKQVFLNQPLAWREGFFFAIEDKAYQGGLLECMKYLDDATDRTNFHQGWEAATMLRTEHNRMLNKGR